MSQKADHTGTLKEMLEKYPNNPYVVIETFYETVTNQDWGIEDIVDLLKYSKGVNEETDSILDDFIEKQLSYHR